MDPISFNQWLRTNEERDAVLGLRVVIDMLKLVRDEPYFWKWVILALHNVLQGFMVLALRGSDGLRVLKDDCAKAWLEAYERADGKYPKPRLKSFLELYEVIKSDQMRIYGISQRSIPNGTQEESIERLNELRNDFVHFTPKFWSLEISGLTQMVIDCIRVISFLAFESKNVFWKEDAMEDETRKSIIEIQSIVDTFNEFPN